MSIFQTPALITDPTTLAANAKAYLEEEVPGWRPAPNGADIISSVIDAFSFPAAEQAEATQLELVEGLKGFAALVGVPTIAAVSASAKAIFTLTAPAPAGGFVVPIYSEIGVRDANGDLQGFRLRANIEIAEGLSSGEALVEAVVPGTDANNLEGPAVLISTPPGVASAALGTSGGGVDEEEEAAFLQRFTETMELIKPGPVLAADAAVIARSIAGIYRATGVDNLKPGSTHEGEGTEETGVEKCVTVAVATVEGLTCTAGEMEAAKTLLQSLREDNFLFFVVKPQYTEVDVTTTVFAWPGLNLAAVKAEVLEAIEAFLSPALHATDSTGNPQRWANDPVLRQGELFGAVGKAAGVRWCSALTFAKHGGTLATANVTLGEGSAVPALPTVGTINITVEPTS